MYVFCSKLSCIWTFAFNTDCQLTVYNNLHNILFTCTYIQNIYTDRKVFD